MLRVHRVPEAKRTGTRRTGTLASFTLLLSTVCGFITQEYLDLIHYNILYAAVRHTSMYLYMLAMYFCCCCCSCSAAACCCCSSSCAGWQKFAAGSLNPIPVFSISSLKRDLFWMYPLAVLCRIYGLDLLIFLAITGMRGAKAGVSPPRRSPPCIR